MDDQRAAESEGSGGITGEGQAPPAYAPPVYAQPAPVQAPSPYPVPYAPPLDTPPAGKRRSTGRTLLVIGMIVVLILAILGGSAVFANAALSSTYGPEKAVSDYLAAQQKGDATYMAKNANFLKGDGSYNQYFDDSALAKMMSYPENAEISNINVATAIVNDAVTRTVNVRMTWHGHQVLRNYTVHKDASRPQAVFYSAWRIDIPYSTIHLDLPNQAGQIAVDNLFLPSGAATADVQVIQGFHKVTMSSTSLYDASTLDADGIDGNPAAIFTSTITPAARAAAAASLKATFKLCGAGYTDCLGKTYYAPNKPGFIYYFTMPGYGDIYYTKYVWTLTSDPTTNMKLVVAANPSEVDASGTCAYTMTVNGNHPYFFKGTLTATLTSKGDTFTSDLVYDCAAKKA